LQPPTYLFATSSAAAAWSAGAFQAEIAPVTLVDARKGDTVISEDEEYKKIKVDKVSSLRPVFSKTGTVTAANASNLNDGASALVLASQEKVDEYGLKPLARIVCECRVLYLSISLSSCPLPLLLSLISPRTQD
jgi:acetyl-CoA acetyltransferase